MSVRRITARALVGSLAFAGLVLWAAPARSEIRTQEVEYTAGATTLKGFFAWDDTAKGPRPGVLIVHEWWGHNQHARNQARRAAEAGYVGFALDMYGDGKVATHPEEAQAFATEATKDPELARQRFLAGHSQLSSRPEVDPGHVAVFGYCFGGGVAMAMARAGTDVDAVVTFHGAIAPSGPPAAKGAVKARILVLTGADDPFVPPETVAAFEKEMTEAGASFEVVSLPGVRHSFTNPEADEHGMEALHYDADADQKSWAKAMALLKNAFGR